MLQKLQTHGLRKTKYLFDSLGYSYILYVNFKHQLININHLIEWFKINKMQANPDKFQVLAVGKKTYVKRPTISIQNFELTCEDSVKLLGLEIDYQLNFDTHISAICRKASQ